MVMTSFTSSSSFCLSLPECIKEDVPWIRSQEMCCSGRFFFLVMVAAVGAVDVGVGVGVGVGFV